MIGSGRITQRARTRSPGPANAACGRVLAAAVVVLGGGIAAPVICAGQGLPPAPPEMGALGWLEGEWTGRGWIAYAPDRRAEFEGTESVAYRMGGRVLVVEGRFTAWMGPEAGRVPVHQALGVMSWDAGSGRYLFRTYTARGGNGEAHVIDVSEGRLEWGYDDPRQGRVRYTITRTEADEWHEVGRASADGGESWRQFFEMTLRRDGG